MEIITYRYEGDDATVQLASENVKLADAITKLKSREIHFFQIRDENSFVELTLSDKGEIITNGCELL